MCIVQPAEQNNFALLNLNSTTDKINKTLSKIKEDFVYIGFLLWEVREYKFYESKGYSSVVEYAEKELNFKKTSTYNFISVCEKFSTKKENGNPTMNLDSKYKDFSFSQLVEIKTLPVEQLNSFSPSMSKRDIREKKKELNSNESNIIDVEFKQDQVVLKENQINFSDKILKDRYEALDIEFTKQLHLNIKKDEKIKMLEKQLKNNSAANQCSSIENIISDILKVLNIEWSNAIDDEYARGLDRAIQIINQKLESNS